jgi:retron-type reverse transcriptase
MYSYSTSCVKINDKLTEFFATKLGVKQGDILSPNLFKIFINDLPSYLSNTKDPVILDNSSIHCLMYADDIVLLNNS